MVATWDGRVSCISFGHCDNDLVSRIIVSGAYLPFYLHLESQILCMDASLNRVSRVPFWVIVTLTDDLVSRIIVSGGYVHNFFEVGIPYLVCGFIL